MENSKKSRKAAVKGLRGFFFVSLIMTASLRCYRSLSASLSRTKPARAKMMLTIQAATRGGKNSFMPKEREMATEM
jgi:hypothetical protein